MSSFRSIDPPFRDKYEDASSVVLTDGASAAQILAARGDSRFRGMGGTVVPSASMGGGSAAFDVEGGIEKINLVSVGDQGNIESVLFDLRQLSNESAVKVSKEMLSARKKARSPADMRALYGDSLVRLARESAASAAAAVAESSAPAPTRQPVIRPSTAKEKPVDERRATAKAAEAVEPSAPPPGFRVTISVNDTLAFDVGYHDVLVSQSETLLALVSDKRHLEANPVNLRMGSCKDVLVALHESDFIFQVAFPGDRLVIGDADIQLLTISRIIRKSEVLAEESSQPSEDSSNGNGQELGDAAETDDL